MTTRTLTRALTRRGALKSAGAIGAFAAMAQACARQAGSAKVEGDDAVALAAQLRAGELTPIEAVNAAIDRAEAANPQINAIVAKTYDAAREAAAKAARNGAMAGVPTFVKDLLEVAGAPTAFGSRAFAGLVSAEQPPFTDDLEAAGLISLGKSATPEFGLTATTEPLLGGAARNPWNLAVSTGGSSGGAAALVAAGVVPLAHASDGGGSIRIPASCCGLVGLKVSRDRFRSARDESKTPVRISVQGAETRTVRDTAAFLAAMEPPKGEGALDPVGLVTGPAKRRLRIGYFTQSVTGVPVHPEVVAATEAAVAICRDLGHDVQPATVAIDPTIADDFLLYWAGIAASVVDDWETRAGRGASEAEFEPFTLGLREHFRSGAAGLQGSVLRLIGFAEVYRRLFDGYDVIASPVLSAPPPNIGWLATDIEYDTAIARLVAYAQYTSPANISGAPSISLPLSMSSDGLPIGVLFNAPFGDERTLLELAFELEAALPWAARRPPLYLA